MEVLYQLSYVGGEVPAWYSGLLPFGAIACDNSTAEIVHGFATARPP